MRQGQETDLCKEEVTADKGICLSFYQRGHHQLTNDNQQYREDTVHYLASNVSHSKDKDQAYLCELTIIQMTACDFKILLQAMQTLNQCCV